MEILPSIYIFTCYLECDGEPPGLLWLQIGGNSSPFQKNMYSGCQMKLANMGHKHFREAKSFLFLKVIDNLQKMKFILFYLATTVHDNHHENCII